MTLSELEDGAQVVGLLARLCCNCTLGLQLGPYLLELQFCGGQRVICAHLILAIVTGEEHIRVCARLQLRDASLELQLALARSLALCVKLLLELSDSRVGGSKLSVRVATRHRGAEALHFHAQLINNPSRLEIIRAGRHRPGYLACVWRGAEGLPRPKSWLRPAAARSSH